MPKNKNNIIKVMGVGGGGNNAVNYMNNKGIEGVNFVVCNTDAQALAESPVNIKVQLGTQLTKGLGAGANPEVGTNAAKESLDELKSVLDDKHTKIIFITAGMGGGTGTGAAPYIASLAKKLDILTIGIVTVPFTFEGQKRKKQAYIGLEKLRTNVDALIVINNDKLREVYGNLSYKTCFAKADEILCTAAFGIASIISKHYKLNIDLRDVRTVLGNSGTAIMGHGAASGKNRAITAVENALDSPLLNDNKIAGCKNVLLLIVSGKEEITMDELGQINDHIQEEAGSSTDIIMGMGEDINMEDEVAVTVIATGFNADLQHELINSEAKKIIYPLRDEEKIEHNLMKEHNDNGFQLTKKERIKDQNEKQDISLSTDETVKRQRHPSTGNEPNTNQNEQAFILNHKTDAVDNVKSKLDPPSDSTNKNQEARQQTAKESEGIKRYKYLQKYNYRFHIEELSKIPAYKRRGLNLKALSNRKTKSRISIDKDIKNELKMRSNNSFLHDNVD